jgi:hypothetical protein
MVFGLSCPDTEGRYTRSSLFGSSEGCVYACGAIGLLQSPALACRSHGEQPAGEGARDFDWVLVD